MKIVFFELEPWEQAALQALEADHELVFVPEVLSIHNAAKYPDAEVLSPFVHSTLSKEVLAHFPRLKMVATRSTGFDHVDKEYCKQHGVVISNVPLYGDVTVAEHAFALLLAISHKIPDAVDGTRRGDFSCKGLCGFDLRDKTLGVVGTGAIGRRAIEIAKGFHMNVLGYDLYPNEEHAKNLGFQYVPFEELLAKADVITLHVPSSPTSKNLLSDAEFALMKKGVVLINTARGNLVDLYALMRALNEGKVAAAGLDVIPEEPIMRDESRLLHSVVQRGDNLESLLAGHVLLRMRNVYITPHSAFNTREAVGRILETTVNNIVGFVAGAPENVVS